jgi:UDP-3-O-[3-hydroxymyristoyl] glucosamine N-acyltransferase
VTDPRFFHRRGPFSLGEIAEQVDAELSTAKAGHLMIRDIAALGDAGAGELSLFYDTRYLRVLAETHAGAIVTSRGLARHAPRGSRLLLAAQPRLAYAQIGHLFYPSPAPDAFIDSGARIDPTATIGLGSRIDSGAVLGPGVEIGRRCHIAANVVLEAGVVLGDDCRIAANTTISHALIGSRVEIGSGVCIGGPGFGYEPHPSGLMRMLQLGRVTIGDDVHVGANCAIDRGTSGDTVIGSGCKLDNLVQIAHNVRLGRSCIICGQAGIAGSATLGDGVMIGGRSAISDHVTIGSGARIAGNSGVMRDIEPGAVVGGFPAMPIRDWHRQTAGLMRSFSRRSPKPDGQET